jgi:adenylate cyclase
VTTRTYQRLRDGYQFQRRGPISVRGMGELVTYLLVGRSR